MRKRYGFLIIITLVLLILSIAPRNGNQLTTKSEPIDFNKQDRVLILAPHPDDEVLCCGGIIQKAVRLGIPVKIVYFTFGDFNEWSFMLYKKHPVLSQKSFESMGLARQNEAIDADNLLGIPKEDIIFLGFPDYGTLKIWCAHWNQTTPYENILTRISSVPYECAYSPGAPYKGDEIIDNINTILREYRPTKIFVSHPDDQNPDHQALYLFTKVALWDSGINADMYPYLIHYRDWPSPKGYHPEQSLYPPQSYNSQTTLFINYLNATEIRIKQDSLKEHKIPYARESRSLTSFVRSNELFWEPPIVYLEADTPEVLEENIEESLPQNLTDVEMETFIGLRQESARLEDNMLILSFQLSKPLMGSPSLTLYVFGYKNNISFNAMPKIRVEVGQAETSVYNQGRKLNNIGVSTGRSDNNITVSIPLSVLGNPDKMFISTQTTLAKLTLDRIPWRVIVIKE